MVFNIIVISKEIKIKLDKIGYVSTVYLTDFLKSMTIFHFMSHSLHQICHDFEYDVSWYLKDMMLDLKEQIQCCSKKYSLQEYFPNANLQ